MTMKNPKYIKPPKSEDCIWRSGPPPEIGWWPASVAKRPTMLRWWNGNAWSSTASAESSAVYAAWIAAVKAVAPTKCVEWTDRWWETKR